jgi:predicted nucleic acid-binding protein
MRIVIDSNVLFSALIKDSTARRLIFEHDEPYLFPAYIIDELERHKDELIEKSHMDKADFEALLTLILDRVEMVDAEQIRPWREAACRLVEDIDINDAVFVACVLANPGSVLWSEDRRLKRICCIRVINTRDILKGL